MPKPYAHLRAQMAPDAIDQAVEKARALLADLADLADLPDASPHEARRAYEAFMALYAPEVPAVWDALPPRIQHAWGVVVETGRQQDA